MSQTSLSILSAQINPVVGAIGRNALQILDIWRGEDVADLIVFPELVLSGYPPEDMVLKPDFMKQIKAQVDLILTESRTFKPAALIGAPWVVDGQTYNCALLIEGGAIKTVIRKHHLPNYGVFDEVRIFKSGPMGSPVPFRGFKLGLMICEDMWHADVAGHLKQQGAEILIVINASPFDHNKSFRRIDNVEKRVRETGLPLIYNHLFGGQDEIVFDGGSFAINADGKTVFEAPIFERNLTHLQIERVANGLMIQPSMLAPRLTHDEKIYKALVVGLRDYVEKNGFPGVLLGLSGGVDSALVAAIAVDALGADKVHTVMMPSRFTSQDSLEDAAAVAKNLGLSLKHIAIEDSVRALEKTIKPAIGSHPPDITFENLQSRTRGIVLMALSNASGKMLLSTGNKSELATGYATLYGDMCGGFNPLKDVYKTQVYDLCRWRNMQDNDPVIPERVLTKAPTAELKHNQTDQDTLPPYDVLDDILTCLIEEDMGLSDTSAKGHDLALVLKVWKMLDSAEYKRRQAAPGVKISTRALGRERRYPMTNHFSKLIEKSGI
jgi:NAD+ synthase